MQGQNREEVIRYIRIGRDVMDPSRKKKLNDGGDQGSYGGHWKRSGVNGPRNLEGQNHGNGARFGVGKGGHFGGRNENNGGGGGARGGNGNSTNPPKKNGHRMLGGVQDCHKRVRL